MSIVVTGSLAWDHIMDFPGRFRDHILPEKVHMLSISFLVDSMKKLRGGTAANIAYNLALLGHRPAVLATAGQDFGEYRAWLEEHGVDTSLIVIAKDDFTSSFFVINDQENNQLGGFYTGAMARARDLSLADVAAAQPVDFCVVAPNDPEAMARTVTECVACAVPYMYDPGQQIPRLSPDQLLAGIEGSRCTIVNDYELQMILNATGLTEDDIAGRTQALMVTLGEHGAYTLSGGERIDIPAAAESGPPVDPTGAGDAYRAGVVTGLLAGLDYGTLGRLGAVAAVYAIEVHGTASHTFTADEFAARYAENFGPLPAAMKLGHA